MINIFNMVRTIMMLIMFMMIIIMRARSPFNWHRLNWHLASRLPDLSLASGSRKCLNCAVPKGIVIIVIIITIILVMIMIIVIIIVHDNGNSNDNMMMINLYYSERYRFPGGLGTRRARSPFDARDRDLTYMGLSTLFV